MKRNVLGNVLVKVWGKIWGKLRGRPDVWQDIVLSHVYPHFMLRWSRPSPQVSTRFPALMDLALGVLHRELGVAVPVSFVRDPEGVKYHGSHICLIVPVKPHSFDACSNVCCGVPQPHAVQACGRTR